MKRLSAKLSDALGDALGRAGNDTSATLALLIIGLHAVGRDISQFRADAYRALSSTDLEPQIANHLQRIINGGIPLADIQHTVVTQQADNRMTFEPEEKTSFPAVFTDDFEDEDDDLDFGMSV
ncbi:hypothetical protein [Herpetosiphon geysericola]|uniref:Uncharacterized protein n=1 Tax=Herpetosiphon geysericola TaxID=70996 RepID=A0A0P6YXP8_9CHLR|nr:hypothetical protein [Herpetosiphon geysericola]KPL90004.1 hypothetical protein SE18_08610 [Herpetosiphon geysericola]